jgi:hypothetical protein
VIDLQSPPNVNDRRVLPKQVMTHSGRGLVLCMAFSADGCRLAVSCSDSVTVVLDLAAETMSLLRIPTHFAHATTSLSFSPDKLSVVTSGPRHCIVAKIGLLGSQLEDEVKNNAPGKLNRSNIVREKKLLMANAATMYHDVGGHENVLASTVLVNGDLVVVQRPWDMVIPTLPRPLRRKVFAS